MAFFRDVPVTSLNPRTSFCEIRVQINCIEVRIDKAMGESILQKPLDSNLMFGAGLLWQSPASSLQYDRQSCSIISALQF